MRPNKRLERAAIDLKRFRSSVAQVATPIPYFLRSTASAAPYKLGA
jgi:hypothetical protein